MLQTCRFFAKHAKGVHLENKKAMSQKLEKKHIIVQYTIYGIHHKPQC